MTSSNFINDLEPAMVWRHFAALSQRPRPSGKEELARKYVTEWAGQQGLQWERDAVGNVVVRAPGRGRGIDAPGVILQGHLDIVCEKNSDVVHDFELDPIRLRRAGDRVFAQGTTLGADNGVGVALALAAAEGLYQHHPPLELLLTVDEESGLSGAMELNGSMLKYRQMINLDAEEEGTLYVGCAGGEDRSVSAPVRRQPLSGVDVGMVISVRGLRGGHSGIDIIHNRGNAIRLLVLALNRLRTMDVPYSLVALNGGSKRNAIPREADAIVRVPVGVGERLVKSVGQIRAELGLLHGESEPGLELSVQPADDNRGALAPELEDGLLKFLFTVPNGVLAMSPSISGLVETSSNLGVMVTGEERIEISLCSRSSRGPALGLVGEQVAMIAGLCDLQYRREGGYPGWQPDPRSPLLRISREVFRREAGGRDPEVTAIHAGLECGILGEVVPGLDMIAFGPDIQDAHSPNESVSIPSVGVVARQLGALLEALCNG